MINESPVPPSSPFAWVSRVMTTAGVPLIVSGVAYLCSHVIAADNKLGMLAGDQARTTNDVAQIASDMKAISRDLYGERYTPEEAKKDLAIRDDRMNVIQAETASRFDKDELEIQHNLDVIEQLQRAKK